MRAAQDCALPTAGIDMAADNDVSISDSEAIVLAGGFGTRLRRVVNDRPKGMAMVAGRPFLEWLVKDLRMQGVRRIVVCTGYMSEFIEDYFGSGQSWGLDIAYSREPAPLGTGGAIKLALSKMEKSRFFVLNGDSYCKFDLQRLQATHLEHAAMATLWLVPVEDSERYGAVALNADHEIEKFREKAGSNGPGLINAGIYLLERRVIEQFDAASAFSLEKDVFHRLAGLGLFGVVGPGPFIDIGTPESYEMADVFMKRHGV